MNEQKLFFRSLKEDRCSYFVEYKPPIPNFQFATLSLVFPDLVTQEAAAQAMEKEAREWVARYPVSVMVSSFDDKDDLLDLAPARPTDHLIAIPDEGGVRNFWRLLKNEEIPADALNPDFLKAVYAGIAYKTDDDLKHDSEDYVRKLRRGWLIVVLWVCVAPASWEILQWAGPNWLATIIMFYGLWKAFKKGMILSGKWKKSPRELQREEEESRMRHYFYHCERNPEGFNRLKSENFEREAREETRKEALKLKEK